MVFEFLERSLEGGWIDLELFHLAWVSLAAGVYIFTYLLEEGRASTGEGLGRGAVLVEARPVTQKTEFRAGRDGYGDDSANVLFW